MTVLANTFAIRNGAYAFSHAAQDLYQKAKRLADLAASIVEGGHAWKGSGAISFLSRVGQQQEDATLAGQAFHQVSEVLNALATQLDQVNQLRTQADQLQSEIHMLEQQSWGAEDTERASIHSQISHLSYRKMQLLYDADAIERKANQTAGDQFNEIADSANRLHVFRWGEDGIDPLAPFSGFSKWVDKVVALRDIQEAISKTIKGFDVKVIRQRKLDGTKNDYARVRNGEVDGIRGTKYYFSNGHNTTQVMKYIDGNAAVKVSIQDMKSALNVKSYTELSALGESVGTKLGLASVAIDTVSHLTTNIEEGRSASHTVAEATVDVATGVGSMLASAWAGAEMGAIGGTVFAGPVGTVVGAVGGFVAGLALSYALEGYKVNGKTATDYMKEGLESAIDGGAGLIKSGVSAISSIFH